MDDLERQPEPSDLELKFDAPTVELRLFTALSRDLSALLVEVGQVHTSTRSSPVRWMVDVKPGSVRLPVRGEPASDEHSLQVPHEIAATVVHGMATLEREAQFPTGFSVKAVELARKFAAQAVRSDVPVSLQNGGDPVKINERLLAHATEVIGPSMTSLGAVEGTLETLNIHETNQFNVYDPLTGRAVRCDFGDRLRLEEVTALVGKRVVATGDVISSPSGQTTSVEVRSLRALPEPATADQVFGILKGFEEVDA